MSEDNPIWAVVAWSVIIGQFSNLIVNLCALFGQQ